MSESELYSIADVSRCFDLSVPALRYYEEQRLIEPTCRVGRVRHYDRDQLVRLAYTLMWHRDAGMTIEETRNIVGTRASHERHELIGGHIERISAQIDDLIAARDTLEHLLTCPSDDPRGCPRTGAELQQRVAAALEPLAPRA